MAVRVRVMSDLHLEFGPLDLEPCGEDVLVVAGDILPGLDGIDWLDTYARRSGAPVVSIAGNHEHYHHEIASNIEGLRERAASTDGRVTFLENEMATVAGLRFAGTTLWTDYRLNAGEDDEARNAVMTIAGMSMNDHRLIERPFGGAFRPSDASFSHVLARQFLERWSGRVDVVLTHHLPSKCSIAGRYAASEINGAYASNLDDLVAASSAALWCHGHTHVSQDYLIGETRVVCNPRGYFGYELNPSFDLQKIVEVKP